MFRHFIKHYENGEVYHFEGVLDDGKTFKVVPGDLLEITDIINRDYDGDIDNLFKQQKNGLITIYRKGSLKNVDPYLFNPE